MFINRMMYGGKKSAARGVMYDALIAVEERAKRGSGRSLDRRLAT
jgi:ribosomal protein S7